MRWRVRHAGEVWWPAPAELRALGEPGIAHTACPGSEGASLSQGAILSFETASGHLSEQARASLLAALTPIPIGELRVLRHNPRDPRHASKTDTEAVRRLLGRG